MPSRLIKDPVRYKTVLCEKFLANGECPYGAKCQFAHGTHELRERGDKKEKKEKKAKRSRADEEDVAEPTCSLCTPAPAAPAQRAASPPPAPPAPARPPANLRLPPGLGISEPAVRKVVTWGPEVLAATPPPSPSTLPSRQLPSPSTPTWTGENEPPQLSRSDSGVRPKVGINSVTGKVELTRISRQASHNTDTVRRQLSLLFDDDDDADGIGAAPTGGAIWQHGPFGMMPPVGAV